MIPYYQTPDGKVVRTRWRWSEADLMTLEDMICAGRTDAQIGRVLACTTTAIRVVRKRRGIPCRRKVLHSANTIAKRLGIPCSKTVTWWLREGYLKGRRGQRCGLNRSWYVTEEALLDFLADARYWHLWGPERIQDANLRQWVTEARNGALFLTTGEVAARLSVAHATVHSYIQKGLLPAVRRGNWLIRAADLVGFVLPCERSKKGISNRRFTTDEDERLVSLRGVGRSWPQIAKDLGRSVGSVYGRFEHVKQGVLV